MAKQLTLIFKEDSGCYQSRSYSSVSGAWPWPLRDLYNEGKEYCWIESSPEKKTFTRIRPYSPTGSAKAILRKTEFLIPDHQLDLVEIVLAVIYSTKTNTTDTAHKTGRNAMNTTKQTIEPSTIATTDPYFGEDTNFVCLFQMGSKFVCKSYLELSKQEWEVMMWQSGDWCHFIVNRDLAGRATVTHTDTSTIQNRGGFTLSKEEATGLTDAEIVAISKERIIQPNDLIAHLKEEYQKLGHSNWSKRTLVARFGIYAVDSLIAQAYLVKSKEGWVALSHTQAGTVANALGNLGMSAASLGELQQYFSEFDQAAA